MSLGMKARRVTADSSVPAAPLGTIPVPRSGMLILLDSGDSHRYTLGHGENRRTRTTPNIHLRGMRPTRYDAGPTDAILLQQMFHRLHWTEEANRSRRHCLREMRPDLRGPDEK